MSVLPVGFGASGFTAYQIANSLCFNGSSYLSRTFGTPTDNKKWTMSFWWKLGKIPSTRVGFFSTNGTVDYFEIMGSGAGTPYAMQLTLNNATGGRLVTNQVFRDFTAWQHIVIVMDTAQVTASDRWKIYVNGVQVTSFSTASYPSQNYSTAINSAVAHYIGADYALTSGYFYDGYKADFYFIDGQALTPSSFGELDSNGVWVPKAYTGSYGNNGFHLDFSDGTSTTTLGYDAAGSNDWTLSGMTRAAGVNECWMVDTPTDSYATLNPLIQNAVPSMGVANGNLTVTRSSAGWASLSSTVRVSSGKWYWEATPTNNGTSQMYGVQTTEALGEYPGQVTTSWGYYTSNGQKYNNASGSSYGSAYSGSNPIGVAIDMDNGKIWFSRDGAWEASGDPAAGTNAAFTSITGDVVPAFGLNNASTACAINFGQRDFTYTPPTGFKALCTANLPAVAISDPSLHHDIDLYTANGTGRNRTGFAFQPDFAWFKARSAARNHVLFDSVRGVTKALSSNLTNADTTDTDGSWLTAFNSDGYSLGPNTTTTYAVNYSTDTMAAWLWKAGGTPTTDNVAGAGNVPTAGSVLIDGVNMSSALAGTIAATRLSANTVAGFSIVTYTGTGANATVAHGLGAAPKLVIIKKRNAAIYDWATWHGSFGGTDGIFLNSTNAKFTDATIYTAAPTSTVINVGTYGAVNGSTDTYVAYCFAEIPQYSKAFSFIGNANADGTYVDLGFLPALVLLKCSSTTGNWYLLDTIRNTYNVLGEQLYPNLTNAASTVTTFDVTSRGIKLRLAGDPNAAQTYIGFAWARTPFGGSNVAPCPAF